MKFSLFAHMERIESSASVATTYAQLYADFIKLCTLADEGGMHAIWTGEHHGMDFTIAPNPFITITDLARRTTHVRLGTGTVVAPFWHPLRLAGEAAMTDIVCQGRLELGIARGAYSYEYERLMPGMDAWAAGGRMRELIPAVQALWKGDYAHHGEYFQFPSSTSAPKPIQHSGPPMWVAARDPNSHEFAVKNRCNVQVTALWQGEEEIVSLMQRFNDACAKHPDIDRPKIMLLQHTYVATDDADKAIAARCLSRYYAQFGAWFKNERPVSQGVIKPMTDAEIKKIPMYAPSEMLANLAIGTSAEIIERLKRYEDLGYDEFAYWIDTGMTTAEKIASLQRFIDEVMPAFD